MIAVDTNVLVRVVTNDDRLQARRALRRMQSDRVWISRTVLLETAWVLRHAYGLDAIAIGRTLTMLADLPTVELEDRAGVLRALAWHGQGMDIADALHLASSGASEAFATFDGALVRLSGGVNARPPVVMP
jgi:predicted nucleic-acid-binding protein